MRTTDHCFHASITQFYFSYDFHQVNVWVQKLPSNVRKRVEVAKLSFPQNKFIHYSFCLMVVDEWHNNGPQDFVTVSLCIQNAINKMHLCSLFITYACPYHNPTTTMGHSIHNVDIIKPLTHTTPYTLSAICLIQWKPGFIREENTSPKCQMPSNVSICPLKSVTMNSQVETPMRMTSMQMSFLRRFLTVCAEIIWLWKPIVAAAGLRRSWRWRCWMWWSWAGVVTHGLRLWGRLNVLPNSLKHLWSFWPIAHSLKTCDICGIVLCDKTAHFRVVFYCGQPKTHLYNNHAV